MILQFVILIILILFSAVFSASETALTSVNRIRLKSKAENGSKRAQSALGILEKYDKALTTILIGNNIVNITSSSIATILAMAIITTNWGESAANSYGALVSTVIVTIVVLIFGEILPKTLAKEHAESFTLFISGAMRFMMIVFTPISAFFLLLQHLATKLFSGREKEVTVTEAELIHIIDEIEDEGVLEEQEGTLVRSALEFDETTVGEILTPRVKVTAVSVNEDINRVKELFFTDGYSRLPVYEKSIDHIIGVVYYKEFIKLLLKKQEFYLHDIVQEVIYVPELMKISEVLKRMQKQKIHFAVVVDQYGGTQGIVTLEDILEELVGEIWDESDEITTMISFVSENVFDVSGELSKIDFNRYFEHRGMDFSISGDSNTVGGWVFELFGKIPEVNEAVRTSDFLITVLDVGERHIRKLRFEILEPKTEQEETRE